MELINKLVPIKRRMRELSPSPLSSNSDPGDLEAAASPGGQPEPDIPPIGPHNQDWLTGFCCSSAAAIAVQFLQSRDPLPITFHLLCLAMVCAVAALFVAKYITSKPCPSARARRCPLWGHSFRLCHHTICPTVAQAHHLDHPCSFPACHFHLQSLLTSSDEYDPGTGDK